MKVRAKSEKGFVLVAAMVILLALTVMGVVMINTATLESRIASLDKEASSATYLTEAGISKVRDWFQDPESFTPFASGYSASAQAPYRDCSQVDHLLVPDPGVLDCASVVALSAASEQTFFRRRVIRAGKREYIDGNNQWSQFTDVDGTNTQDVFNPTDSGTDMPALTIEDAGYLDSLFKDVSSIGKVISIKIYPPINNPLSGTATQRPRPICTVRVTAETNSGIRKTVEAEIKESIFLTIDAGAQAAGAGQWNGNGTIHWGEVKVIGNVELKTVQTPTRCDGLLAGNDQWFRSRITGCFTDNGGICNNGPATPDTLCADADPLTNDCLGCVAANGVSAERPYQDLALYQNQAAADVVLDKWVKEDMQDFALTEGSYYKVDTATNQVYKSNKAGAQLSTPVAFDGAWLAGNTDPFLYLDARNADGSAGTLNLQVNFYKEGDIYIDGSLQMTAGAGGENLTVEDPGGNSQPINNVNFNGILYMTGSLSGGGGPTIFGGVVAEGGLSSTGTPQIWYDRELAEGRRSLPKSGKGMWREIM